MIDIEITHSCGHKSTWDCSCGIGWKKEKIKREQHPCPACLQAQQLADEIAEIGEIDLPELRGSEKQIPWAEGIRSNRLAHLAHWIKACAKGATLQKLLAGEVTEKGAADLAETIQRLIIHDEAAWWIDHREDMYQIADILKIS